MVYISHIISNCNVVENGRVNKCKFMFHFVIFFSNQDSAERKDVRLKTAAEVFGIRSNALYGNGTTY